MKGNVLPIRPPYSVTQAHCLGYITVFPFHFTTYFGLQSAYAT